LTGCLKQQQNIPSISVLFMIKFARCTLKGLKDYQSRLRSSLLGIYVLCFFVIFFHKRHPVLVWNYLLFFAIQDQKMPGFEPQTLRFPAHSATMTPCLADFEMNPTIYFFAQSTRVFVYNLVMGTGQNFLTRVRLGWVSHLWVLKISPKNLKFINLLPFRSKKVSSG